jgi:hypothetical protein
MKMTKIKTNNKCRRIRARLYTACGRHFGLEADWLNNHIMHCPRCRRRLIDRGKVELALSFIKNQPHNLDLLNRANTQAIGVLKHSLRQEPKALELKKTPPEPKLLERCGNYGHYAANLAACVLVLLLMKIGVFSSMNNFHNQGQKVIRQYYSRQVGEDLADEVFPKDSKPPTAKRPARLTNA